METQNSVLEALRKSSEPMKAGEISEQTGIDKKEVSKAIKALIAEEKAFSPKFCYYSAK